MRKIMTLCAVLTLCIACAEQEPASLADRLKAAADSGKILYGHQDDLSYGHQWRVSDWSNDPLERSDVKDVTGKYPMVLGFDLGGIELGREANLDNVPFGLIRKAARVHARRGGIVTFSWHPRNPLTGGDAWDVSSDQVVASILPGGSLEEEFGLWMKRLGDFLESLGEDVPVIFRPWHENLGSWFWWGLDLCTEQQYIELFRLVWRYCTQERGLKNLLWCYSPNGDAGPQAYISRYPGDEFVDILGVDTYEFVGDGTVEDASRRYVQEIKVNLTYLQELASAHGKLMCLSETGLEGLVEPAWWTGILEPAIRNFPICYVLTWRNADDRPEHFYAAWKGFEYEADMKAFSELDNIVFLD